MRRENEKDQALITEVKQKLDWYINDASDKEYDEKAVASLEYLLETLEPTDDFKVDEEKAWVEFKDYVAQREAHGGAKKDKTPKTKKHPAFWSRHKGLVAAALLVLILAVSIGTSSEAVRDNGFFHWIKEMVGGREMVTSPDSLDESIKSPEPLTIYNRADIPEEWRAWSDIEHSVMLEQVYEWKYIEIDEYQGKTTAHSHYSHQQGSIIVGVASYSNETLWGTEKFDRFKKNETWIIDGVEFCVSRIKDDKKFVYIIEFTDATQAYYVAGPEGALNEIKELAMKYKRATEEKKVK